MPKMRSTAVRAICALMVAAGAAAALSASVSDTAGPAGAAGEGRRQAPVTVSKRPALFAPVAGTAPPPASDLAKHAIRRAVLTVSEKAVASGLVISAEAHLFNLFPDVEILAMRNRVESRSSSDYSWFGHIPGDAFGYAIVTVVNGTLGAIVNTATRRYVVLPIGDGQHEAVEVDLASFPEGRDLDTGTAIQTRGGDGRAASQVGVASLDAGGLIQLLDLRFATANGNAGHAIGPVGDEGSFIDVIFVYTHGAAHETDPLNISPIHFVWHLPPSNLIVRLQLAIDDLNRSLEGSSVDTRMLRIGDAIEDTEYHESGVMSDDLAAVRNGELNGVHQRREDLAADLVALITSGGVNADNEPLCGLTRTKEEGNTASFNAAHGFLVVASTCLGTTLALAHQFGHDLGTTHDWYSYYATGDTTNVAIQAHGFITKLPPDYPYMGNYRYRSIMALPHYCTQVLGIPKSELNTRCRQTQYWSDWSKTTPIGYGFPPIPNGGPVPEVPFLAVADEVPELNINRVDVSNYRRSVCRALSVC